MKSSQFIALDIGEECLRAAVFLASRSGGLELEHVCEAPYEVGMAGMSREAVVATTLKTLLLKLKKTVRPTLISLEGSAVFSRLVTLPPVSQERLQQTIRHEAVQNIPFPIEDVVWDALVADASAAEPEALLVAVKADFSAGMISAVMANGLVVSSVDVAPAALAAAVRHNYDDVKGPILLVDAGPCSSNLVFTEGCRTFFRTLPVGTKEVSRLQQEISRSITFYCNQQGGASPELVLLGNTAEPVLAALSEEMALPVDVFNPLRNVSSQIECGAEQSARLGVVVGLGLRELSAEGDRRIELIPEEMIKSRERKRRQPLIVACLLVAAFIAWVWVASINQSVVSTRTARARVDEMVSGMERIDAQMKPLEERIQQLERDAKLYQELDRARSFWIDALEEVNAQLSEGMFLLKSETLLDEGRPIGLRVHVLSYLDKEPEGEDVVILLRDRLRDSERFSAKSVVNRRPAKRSFARRFILDLFFEEPMWP